MTLVQAYKYHIQGLAVDNPTQAQRRLIKYCLLDVYASQWITRRFLVKLPG